MLDRVRYPLPERPDLSALLTPLTLAELDRLERVLVASNPSGFPVMVDLAAIVDALKNVPLPTTDYRTDPGIYADTLVDDTRPRRSRRRRRYTEDEDAA